MSPEQQILALADHCVKCGLCLPQCPTYNLSFNENESPRGRIALIQGVVNGQLDASNKLFEHLDNCLLCQRCERVCPSGVEYGRLMDLSRQLFKTRRQPSIFKKVGLKLLQHPKQVNTLGSLLRLYQKTHLDQLLQHTPLLRNYKLVRLQTLLPKPVSSARLRNHYPAIGEKQGEVALFSGCLGEAADRVTLNSTIKLLTHCGYDVQIPVKQSCCGALHQHNGEAEQALSLAEKNLQAFDSNKLDAIIYTTSGCGAQLKNYTRLFHTGQRSQSAMHFSNKLMDITEFLNTANRMQQLSFKPLNKTVVIHQPCSQRNALRLPNHAMTLLEHIPDIRIRNLPDNISCCGAAGDYMLRHPEAAQTLRRHLLDKITAEPVDIINTTNMGCALFMNAGIQGSTIRLMHPVTLLAEQLLPTSM